MTETRRPPAWAEAVLHVSLARADRESVSGDLLEAYRDSIVPERGEAAADIWYLRQVAGYLWRATFIWALVFSGQFIARCAYDWAVPTHDYHVRAQLSTQFGTATMLLLSVWTSWRSGSFASGPILTAVMSQIAAVVSVSGALLMLALWPDPAARLDRAIAESGGIEEVYLLPFMMIVPGLIIGTVGGAIGSVGCRVLRAKAAN